MAPDTLARRARATMADVAVLAELERLGRLTMGQLADQMKRLGPLSSEGEPVLVAATKRLAEEGLVKLDMGTCLITDAGREALARSQEEMLRVLAIEAPSQRWPQTTRRASAFISHS